MSISKVLIAVLAVSFFPGCTNLRHAAQEEYAKDPIVNIQYKPEEQITIFDTRTMNFDARECEGKRCLLNCSASIVCQGEPSSTQGSRLQQLNFRSLSPVPRFLDERHLKLTVDGHLYDLGSCTHDGMKTTEGGVLEDLSVRVEKEHILALARADTVRGELGILQFEIVKGTLLPLERLVGVAGCLTK